MKQGSMLEEAKKILEANGKELPFKELWARVKAALEISAEEEPDRIGHFFTDLSMSSLFVIVGENYWDLSSRHTFEDSHIDVTSVYSEVNESSGDASDEAEDKEYDESVKGSSDYGEDEEGGSEEDEENGNKESSEEFSY